MERKAGIGSRTLAIDGRPVRHRDPAAEGACRCAERKALRRAELTLARSRLALLREHGAVQEDAAADHLASFTAAVGHKLLGRRGLPPRVKWFNPADRPDSDAYMIAGDPLTWVRLDLRDEPLVWAVLHEARHHHQSDTKAAGAEEEAERFARRWTRPTWRAYSWTDGRASRVHPSRVPRPSFPGTYRRGDVVLSTPSAKAWAFTPQNLNTWSAIA